MIAPKNKKRAPVSVYVRVTPFLPFESRFSRGVLYSKILQVGSM